jgi:dipeptidase E
MRLYLSSFRIGNRPDELLKLLAGHRRTALILNADDYKGDVDRAASLRREIDELEGIGLEPVEVDLRRYFGKATELRGRLSRFDLIYVRGGNVFILRRAFHQSGADEILRDLLATDTIVYAGYSAGACILAPTLRGLELSGDDPTITPASYANPAVWEGLHILPYAIAPHYRSDLLETDAIDKLVAYYINHHLPFVALRDGEALVVDGDRQEVIG